MVCVMVLLAWLPNAIVMLSWIQSGGAGLVFIPMVYNNAFIIPSWILGTLSLIPGLLAAYSASYVLFATFPVYSLDLPREPLC